MTSTASIKEFFYNIYDSSLPILFSVACFSNPNSNVLLAMYVKSYTYKFCITPHYLTWKCGDMSMWRHNRTYDVMNDQVIANRYMQVYFPCFADTFYMWVIKHTYETRPFKIKLCTNTISNDLHHFSSISYIIKRHVSRLNNWCKALKWNTQKIIFQLLLLYFIHLIYC